MKNIFFYINTTYKWVKVKAKLVALQAMLT